MMFLGYTFSYGKVYVIIFCYETWNQLWFAL